MYGHNLVTVVTYNEGGIHELCGVYRDFDRAVADVTEEFDSTHGEWEVISDRSPRTRVFKFGDAEVWVEEFPITE